MKNKVKENHYDYMIEDIKEVLQNGLFWQYVKQFHKVFRLKNTKVDVYKLSKSEDALAHKCVLLNNDRLRHYNASVRKNGSECYDEFYDELYIEQLDWWRNIIGVAMQFIITRCNIPNYYGKDEQSTWDMCWHDIIAKCILQPQLKLCFYKEKLSNDLIRQLIYTQNH